MKTSIQRKIVMVSMCVLAIGLLLIEYLSPTYLEDALKNAWIGHILRNLCGVGVAIGFVYLLEIKPFQRPNHIICFILCLIIAANNFPLISVLRGNMQIVRSHPLEIIFFALYCLSIGLCEELIFRGILFTTLADGFSKDKKGLIKAFILSSALFGALHILNLAYGAGFLPTMLQVGYSILTGGLFCFVFIKTSNVLCAAVIHAVYNFCGLVFENAGQLGLGLGIVWDTWTIVLMILVYAVGGVYVIYSLYKYTEDEQKYLYKRLNIR